MQQCNYAIKGLFTDNNHVLSALSDPDLVRMLRQPDNVPMLCLAMPICTALYAGSYVAFANKRFNLEIGVVCFACGC